MSWSPTVTNESQAVPGVSYTIRRIGLGRRTEIDLKCLKLRQRMRELEADYPPLTDRERDLQEQLAIAERKAEALALAGNLAEAEAVALNEIPGLRRDAEAAAPAGARKVRDPIDEEFRLVDAQIRAVWIREGLIQIKGGEFEDMTADQLLEYGPPLLAQEIYAELVTSGQLRGAASKNLQSPGTSGSQADGERTGTTVPDARSTDGTVTATASSISSGT